MPAFFVYEAGTCSMIPTIFRFLPLFFAFLLLPLEASAYWKSHYSSTYSSNQSGLSEWKSNRVQYSLPYYISSFPVHYYKFSGHEECTGNRTCARLDFYIWIGSEPLSPVDCSDERTTCSSSIPQIPTCEAPNYINEAGDCVAPPTESECAEIGEYYNPVTDRCTPVCENGSFNDSCLLKPDPDPAECSREHPLYRGEVVLKFGQDPIAACGNFDQCQGDIDGQVGFFNGEMRCIAKDYGDAAVCKSDSILVHSEYGVVCEALYNKPEGDPEPEEEPNTDTTGDGQPDTYKPENDPASLDKALDKTNKGLAELNDSIKKNDQNLNRIYGAVADISGQLKQQNDDLNDGIQGSIYQFETGTHGTGKLGEEDLDITDNVDIEVKDLLGNYGDVPDPVVSECPAPRELALALGTFNLVWTPFCDFAEQIRPLTIFMFSFLGVLAIARTINN